MEALVLDKDFKSVGIVDTYISFIWTDRFSECGDFEICTPSDLDMIALLKPGYYLWFKESDHQMLIEGYETVSDVETDNTIIFTGRSLESILDRRIIWTQTNIDENLQDGIEKLLNENVINPSDSSRKIENFIFKRSTDERITKLKLTAQYTGDNLYDVICTICKENKIGFKVVLTDENKFEFSLYLGQDRSYAQDANGYVVFSPDYENILNSDYLESNKTYKNVTLVAGEGEGAERRVVTVGAAEGLDRRELFTDARDISSSVDGGTISDDEYMNQLVQRGTEKLSENKMVKTFDGEMDTSQLYSFKEHYDIGDIVQLKDIYGIEASARIIEYIFSKSVSEESRYPTFEIIDEDGETYSSGGGSMGSSGGSTSGSSAGSTAVYTKNEVDKLLAEVSGASEIPEGDILAICKL